MISIDYKQKHKTDIGGGKSSSPNDGDNGGDNKNIATKRQTETANDKKPEGDNGGDDKDMDTKRQTVNDKKPEEEKANYNTNAENPENFDGLELSNTDSTLIAKNTTGMKRKEMLIIDDMPEP